MSQTTPTLSPDGMFYWDGQAWRPAVSADGMWRYDGRSWQPTGYVPPRLGKPVREPTRWTRPLQAAVIAWQVLGLAVGLVLVLVFLPSFFNQALGQSGSPPDAQTTQLLSTLITFFAVVGLVFGGAIAVLVVVGALKRWTWLFWTLTVLYLFGAVGLVENIAFFFTAPASGGLQLPVWYYGYGVLSGLISTSLGVAMVLAGARIGPWACRRVF